MLTSDKIYKSRSLYLIDQFKVSLFTKKIQIFGTCTKISLIGIEVVIPEEKENERRQIERGDYVELLVHTPAGVSLPIAGQVIALNHSSLQSSRYLRLAIQFTDNQILDNKFGRLYGESFPIAEIIQPNCYCENPLYMAETVFFRLTHFRANGGTLTTSLRNRGLFPGIPLNLTIQIPGQGEFTTVAIPQQISRMTMNNDRFKIEVKFESFRPHLQEAISEYILLSFPKTSITRLKKSGFFVGSISNAITVGYPQDGVDFDKILSLRFRAYTEVGKFLDRKKPKDMLDPYDSFSRHLVCKVGGHIAGSMRIVFPGSKGEHSEHLSMGLKIPNFILKAGFVEFSRACTDRRYRGSDVYVSLIQHAMRITAQAAIPYIISNCNPETWPFYQKIGAKKIGRTFSAFGRDDCQLLYTSTSHVASGYNVDFTFWNQVTFVPNKFMQLYRTCYERLKMLPILLIHSSARFLVTYLRRNKRYRRYKESKRSLQPSSR